MENVNGKKTAKRSKRLQYSGTPKSSPSMAIPLQNFSFGSSINRGKLPGGSRDITSHDNLSKYEGHGKTEGKKIKFVNDFTVQGEGVEIQELAEIEAANNAQKTAKNVRQLSRLRSYPVRYTHCGRGIVLGSEVTLSLDCLISKKAHKFDAKTSPTMCSRAGSRQRAEPSADGAQSHHSSVPILKRKGRELYKSYKKAKEVCIEWLQKEEYGLYEAAANECVRFYFEWALSLLADWHLSKAKDQQSSGTGHINRRRHLGEVYQYLTNHLIPLRIRELDRIDRHQSTHSFHEYG